MGNGIAESLQLVVGLFEFVCPFVANACEFQMGPHPRPKFLRGKWLCQIIVCARIQSFDSRFFARSCRQQNYRKSPRAGVGP